MQSLVPEPPVIPLSSFLPIPFIAASLLYASPHTSRAARRLASLSYHFWLSFSSTVVFAMVFGYLAFHQPFSLVDVVIAGLLVYGKSYLSVFYERKGWCHRLEGSSLDDAGSAIQTPGISRLARAYLKTILSNPESRKIFYFLMLNLSYMGVQVVYGVITNSLGLISDGKYPMTPQMYLSMRSGDVSHTYGIRLHGHRDGIVCLSCSNLDAQWTVYLWVSFKSCNHLYCSDPW